MTISSLLLTQASHHGTTTRSSIRAIQSIGEAIASTTVHNLRWNKQTSRTGAAVLPASQSAVLPGPGPAPTTATRGGDDGARPNVRRHGVQVAGPATRRNAASEIHVQRKGNEAGPRKIKANLSACARVATHGVSTRRASSRGRRRTRRYGLRRHRDQR